ncbi:hypothetical protein AZE42_02678 [Rhizopogon vesiculosus]|uniref:Uncharacterized protein n=1 Tax=Rhizopogon vesiculosus TaxID=180088 RepID=A0A1J8Q3W1_9AGAM|nr:hypothetical protein AZE42_02678 [Rhizopogon vesiculosus]
MANRRTPADDDHALASSGSHNRNDQLQDTLSSSSSLPTSFHSTTAATAAATTDVRQWYTDSQMGASFYDPAQVSGFEDQQPVNVWNPQYAGTGLQGGEYFTEQHQQQQAYQQPYAFEGSSTNQYSFPQQAYRQIHQQQQSQQPPHQGPARGSARASAHYRQRGAESQMYPFQQHQYSQVPQAQAPSVTQPQLPQPAPQQHQAESPASQQPTGQALAAQRTSQLIAQGQFTEVQAEPQYTAQQGQSQISPPPTQTQFQIQQFPQAQHFPQTQVPVQAEARFSHSRGHTQSQTHAHGQPQLRAHIQTHPQTHAHVQAHVRSQVHVHGPGQTPNDPQQSQHYPPSDTYYLSNEAQSMYYAMNAQGSQSLPSLVSLLATSFIWIRSLKRASPFFVPHLHLLSMSADD